MPENDERLILATGRYIGEGFDDARLHTLFLALPVSWKGTLVQYAGRLHRLHPGKHEVRMRTTWTEKYRYSRECMSNVLSAIALWEIGKMKTRISWNSHYG